MNKALPPEERIVWGVASQFWVDTWYDDQQLDQFAHELEQTGLATSTLQTIAHDNVCAAFAMFTLQSYFSIGMALPDWFFEDELLDPIIQAHFEQAPWRRRWNPIWHLAYRWSRGFLLEDWADLCARVEQIRESQNQNQSHSHSQS